MMLCLCVAMLTTYAQPTSPESNFIKVDQFGYLPNASKVAVISDPQIGYNASDAFTPGGTYQLREFTSGNVVFSGNPQTWNGGATHAQSGDRGWWFDFSGVTAPGTYYVYDVTNNVRSYEFEINNDVYNAALQAATRMFYYNRSGVAKVAPYAEGNWTYNGAAFQQQDSNCRFYLTPDDASTAKDLDGGWFDAGDFNKYITFANRPVHDLLWAYRENPTVFGDNWNIPESGNGMPDVLDELKWELDWMFKMNNADGSTHIKMGSISHNDNAQTPPDLNTDPRYYGPVCSSASIAVAGMFAHAAQVFQGVSGMNGFAQELRNRAETSWNYVLPALNNNQLSTTCDDQVIKAGDADWAIHTQRERALSAAIYLFELTGNNTYNQYIINNIGDAFQQITNNYWDHYMMPLNDALLLYPSLSNADNTTVNLINNSIQSNASGNFNDLYGFDANVDLYRAQMFQYGWGSNREISAIGALNQLLIKRGINSGSHAAYQQRTEEMAHYIHGVNPLGITYLTNMYNLGGDNCANEMYHDWFKNESIWDNVFTSNGPAPGYLVGGANPTFSLPNISPPGSQPAQKSYLDYNTGYLPAGSPEPHNSWEISEPSITYQGAYVRLMAFLSTGNGTSCPLAGTSCYDGDPNTTNDVHDGNCNCINSSSCPPIGTSCDDGNPNTANDIEDGNCNCAGTPIQNGDCQLVINGTFDTDVSDWNYWGCTPTSVNGVANLTGMTTGVNPWDAGFSQYNTTLVQGETYVLTFDASAAANRTVDIKVGLPLAPFTAYVSETVNLTTSMQTFTYIFTMTDPTANNAGLDFFLGLASADVFIDNVELTEVGCDTPPGDCQLITNGTFDTDVSDWFYWGCTPTSVNGVANLTGMTTGVNPWDAGFSQYDMTLVQGKSYILSFEASAAANRTVDIKVGLPAAPFTAFVSETVNLTTSMQTFVYPFTMTDPTATNAGLDFFLGLASADVFIDNVVLVEVGCGAACELLSNNDFDNNVSDWNYWACSPTSVNGVANLTGIVVGANPWDAGFSQYNMTLTQGKIYTLTFKASAAANRTVDLKVGIPVAPFTTYLSETANLTTSMQTFTYTFVMTEPTASNAGLDFFIGLNSADIYIDYVNFVENDCEQNSCPPVELLSGNTNTNITYHAAQTVSSDATINAEVMYKAGNCIELKSGFSTNPTNNFSAEIEDCDGN